MPRKLSHYDRTGRAKMVDVSAKSASMREAEASAFVAMKPAVLKALPKNPKGDPLEVARLAGIMAAKRTADLIPMCHPLPLAHVDVAMRLCENGVAITSKVSTTAVTGVEMEALVADSVAITHVPGKKSGGKFNGEQCQSVAGGRQSHGAGNVAKCADTAGDRHHRNGRGRRSTESRGRSSRSAGERLSHAWHGWPPVGGEIEEPFQYRRHCSDSAGYTDRHQ